MSLEYNKKMIPRAKTLRRPMTRQERHLWYDFLSDYPVRFQRQKVIGSYIADFFCHDALLVVELDGAKHYEAQAQAYDRVRTEFLASAGIEVLRIPNASIERDFAGVCTLIDRTAKARRGMAEAVLPKRYRDNAGECAGSDETNHGRT